MIARNSSVLVRSAEAEEVHGTREAAARSSSALGKLRLGGGPGGGSLVGSGRGLELGGGLDARERGGAGTGVRTLGPPGAEPGRREVTAGILRPRVTQLPRRPETEGARGVRGPGGVPRRKWEGVTKEPRGRQEMGGYGSGRPNPRGAAEAGLLQVAGMGRGFPRWRGRGAGAGRGRSLGGGTPPPALSLPPALGAPARYSAPAGLLGHGSTARPDPQRGRSVCGVTGGPGEARMDGDGWTRVPGRAWQCPPGSGAHLSSPSLAPATPSALGALGSPSSRCLPGFQRPPGSSVPPGRARCPARFRSALAQSLPSNFWSCLQVTSTPKHWPPAESQK